MYVYVQTIAQYPIKYEIYLKNNQLLCKFNAHKGVHRDIHRAGIGIFNCYINTNIVDI